MLKEGFEDYRRHQADDRINQSVAHVLRNSFIEDVRWCDIRVGDIILIYNKEAVPADFVIVCSSGENGGCFIETSNLDG